MTIPVVSIQFDANPQQATEFVLDLSALDDSSDSLAATPRWVDATAVDLPLSGSVKIGKQSIDSTVQPGELTLTCDNFSGNFDPDNPYSAFNVAPPGLVKGMLCRVQVTFNATTYTIFTGRLDNVTLTKGYDLQATLTFLDDLVVAGNTAMQSFDDAVRPESSGSRAAWLVGMLVNPAGITANLSSSLTRMLLPTFGGGSVLDMLNTVATAEAGRVFVDSSGVLQVTAHADDLAATSLATIDDASGIEFEALVTGSARMNVVNGCILDRYGRDDSAYPSVFGGDANSAALYGQTTIDVVAPLADDAEAQELAIYYGTRRARPAPSIDSVTVNFNGQTAAAPLLAATLGDALTVHRTVPYRTAVQVIDLVALIEGIQWDFDVGQFKGTFYLFPADITSLFGGAGAFTLDTSALDGADVLAAY